MHGLQRVHLVGWLYKEHVHFPPAQLSNTELGHISKPDFFYFPLPFGTEQRPLWKQQRKALPTLFRNFSFLTLLVFLMQTKCNED